MENTEYITKEGDRWDSISYKMYGDVYKIDELIKANPGVPVNGKLEAGLTLKVPILSEKEADKTSLPPWKK